MSSLGGEARSTTSKSLEVAPLWGGRVEGSNRSRGLSGSKRGGEFGVESFDQTGDVRGPGDLALEVKQKMVTVFEEKNKMGHECFRGGTFQVQ